MYELIYDAFSTLTRIYFLSVNFLFVTANFNQTIFFPSLLIIQGKLGEQTPFLDRCIQLTKADCTSVPLHVFVLDAYEDKIDSSVATEEILKHGQEV